MCITSGQAATLLSTLNICNTDNSSISTTEVYGGSVNLFSFTLKKLGIECIYTDENTSDKEIDKAFQPNTKTVFGEAIVSLTLTVLDIECSARTAHRRNVLLIVDNIFAMSVLCKPFRYGVDIVIHSTSKYIDDHAVQVGGCIIGSGDFDRARGNFPDPTKPDESYHGISYTKAYGKKAYIVKARVQLMHDFGIYPTVYSASLLSLGLETLVVRTKQYCKNAMAVVRYLEKSPYVKRVIYPGLESYESYPLVQKYLKGYSGVISLVIKGGKETVIRSMSTLELASNEVHVTGICTYVLYPASEAHRQFTGEQSIAADIESGMIRFLVGLENTEGAITDLNKTFSVIEY